MVFWVCGQRTGLFRVFWWLFCKFSGYSASLGKAQAGRDVALFLSNSGGTQECVVAASQLMARAMTGEKAIIMVLVQHGIRTDTGIGISPARLALSGLS